MVRRVIFALTQLLDLSVRQAAQKGKVFEV